MFTFEIIRQYTIKRAPVSKHSTNSLSLNYELKCFHEQPKNGSNFATKPSAESDSIISFGNAFQISIAHGKYEYLNVSQCVDIA